jgi:hypothetical protein
LIVSLFVERAYKHASVLALVVHNLHTLLVGMAVCVCIRKYPFGLNVVNYRMNITTMYLHEVVCCTLKCFVLCLQFADIQFDQQEQGGKNWQRTHMRDIKYKY